MSFVGCPLAAEVVEILSRSAAGLSGFRQQPFRAPESAVVLPSALLRTETSTRRRNKVLDLVFVAVTVGLFGVLALIVRGVERL